MPFPISARGTIVLESANLTQAFAGVEAAIQDAKPSTMSVTPTEIRFATSAFRSVSRYNLLNSIGSGDVKFTETGRTVEVQYHISLLRTVSVMSTSLVILSLVARIPGLVIAIAWFWVVAILYAVTTRRFPAALRKAASVHAPHI